MAADSMFLTHVCNISLSIAGAAESHSVKSVFGLKTLADGG